MNSGPSDVLHRFLSHVSMNVEEVYSSEQDGVVLTSCISECTFCVCDLFANLFVLLIRHVI